MRAAAAAILLLLLLAASASAGVAQRQDLATTVNAATPPLTLLAGLFGTTTMNQAGTGATTTHAGSLAVAHQVLKIHKSSGDWDIRLHLASATGFGVLDTATVREVLGATTQVQTIVAAGGTITQSTGLPISLTSSASDISITVQGTKVGGSPSVLTFTVIAVPQGAATPVLTYNYVLTLTT